MNTYSYVYNNPLYWIDKYGLAPGDRYPSLNCAACAASKDISNNPNSAQYEYISTLYQNRGDGTYSYTEPKTDYKQDGVTSETVPYQDGKTEGDAHNHPKIEPYKYNIPSDDDKKAAEDLDRPVFILTPDDGLIKLLPDGDIEPVNCD